MRVALLALLFGVVVAGEPPPPHSSPRPPLTRPRPLMSPN